MADSHGFARSPRFFWFACGFELILLPVAAGLAYLTGRPLLSDLTWSVTDLIVGVVATVPLLVLFYWMIRSPLGAFAGIRRLLVDKVCPIFSRWSVLELAVISVLAGICEEALFRSVVQGGLAELTGPVPGLLIASLLFGGAHLVTYTYGFIAALIGGYLGLMWLLGGNLLIPMVTHALYDFAVLLYLLRVWRPERSH